MIAVLALFLMVSSWCVSQSDREGHWDKVCAFVRMQANSNLKVCENNADATSGANESLLLQTLFLSEPHCLGLVIDIGSF